MRFLRSNSEVVELPLCLSPCQRGDAIEGGRITVLVGDVECVMTRSRHERPKRHPYGLASRHTHPSAQAEYGIEDGADRVRERPTLIHRDGRPQALAAAEKARAIGFELNIAARLAFDD